MGSIFEPIECPVCGKLFVPAPQHMYYTTNKFSKKIYQCSYSCYKKAGGETKKPKGPRRKDTDGTD